MGLPASTQLENALRIRRDALEALEPVPRVYEGCARGLVGEVEGANVLKLHRYSGKVSYPVCPGLFTALSEGWIRYHIRRSKWRPGLPGQSRG